MVIGFGAITRDTKVINSEAGGEKNSIKAVGGERSREPREIGLLESSTDSFVHCN